MVHPFQRASAGKGHGLSALSGHDDARAHEATVFVDQRGNQFAVAHPARPPYKKRPPQPGVPGLNLGSPAALL